MQSNQTIKRLRGLTVADVMNNQVVTIGDDQPLSEVAETFAQHNISAAPVVDGTNQVVGILSATDFLYTRADGTARRHAPADRCDMIAGHEADTAASRMTKAIRTMTPDAPLLQAASIMLFEHIHRLPVLNKQGRVVGMVSTMDITAAVVNIVQEFDAQSPSNTHGRSEH